MLLITSILSLFIWKVNSYHPVFCTDLTTSVLSIEALDAELYMLGSRWDAVEMLTSQKAADSFKKVLDTYCLKENERELACYSEMRRSFMKALTSFAGLLPNAKPVNPDPGFITYWNRKNCTWTPYTRKLFTVSCLSMCWVAHTAQDKIKYDTMCPNPCKTQDVCHFKDCERLGIFEHQYKCNCPKDHLWDYEIHACISQPLNALRTEQSFGPDNAELDVCSCDSLGTEYCVRDVSEPKFRCICKPQYRGDLCNEPVNACQQRMQHPYLMNGGLLAAGDRACNVNQEGNTCISLISNEGDVYYKCKCDGRNWGPDPKLPYDNCLKRVSQCDSIVCIHGKCVTNEHGTQPTCICTVGYSGEMCSEWTGEWSEWSPWDKCRPSCGDVRYSVRSRDCQSMTNNEGLLEIRECVGASVEYARCAEHPCARTEGTFVNTYFAIRQNAIASSLSTAAVVCALITVIWVLFFWTTVSRPLLKILFRLYHHYIPSSG